MKNVHYMRDYKPTLETGSDEGNKRAIKKPRIKPFLIKYAKKVTVFIISFLGALVLALSSMARTLSKIAAFCLGLSGVLAFFLLPESSENRIPLLLSLFAAIVVSVLIPALLSMLAGWLIILSQKISAR